LASAQVFGGGGSTATPLTCTANVTAPTQLRAEAITDQIGDIVIVCTGGGPFPANGAAVPTVNITVSLQTNVTSRVLANGGSEALLLIDEPGSGLPGAGASLPQTVCSNGTTAAGGAGAGGTCTSTVVGTFTTPGGVTTTWSNDGVHVPNVFQGIVTAANQVTFQGVPVLPPVTAGAQRIFRITNIRANVAGLPGGGLPGTTQLVASVSTSNVAVLPVTNPVQIAGFVQTGLKTAVQKVDLSGTGVFSFLQCNGTGGKATAPVQGATLRYTENFATAFKTRVAASPTNSGLFSGPAFIQNVPGTIYNSESGFILPVGGGTAGLADFGTRLRAVFANIPAGVRVYVSTTNLPVPAGIVTPQGPFNQPANNSTASIAVEVQTETAPDFSNSAPTVSPTAATGGVQLAEVNLVNGAGEAVWEVISSNPNLSENFDFGVYFFGPANTANNLPALGTGTVDMSFAPVSTNTSASSSAPIPRFVDLSTGGLNLVTVKICQTDLLFPFVTNEAGFETGLAIANTTTDPFGTTAQNGACAMSFYGDNTVATNATTTAPCLTAGACSGTISSGKVYTNTVSGVVGSAFQGYMIAVCNFQFAHGFAFVSDTHATNLAMGYLAIVLTDGGTGLSRGNSWETWAH